MHFMPIKHFELEFDKERKTERMVEKERCKGDRERQSGRERKMRGKNRERDVFQHHSNTMCRRAPTSLLLITAGAKVHHFDAPLTLL